MNRKQAMGGMAICLLAVLLGSCQTAPVVWDSSFPEQELATVQFINMKLDSFNGIAVSKFNWVKIPAGEVQLGGEVLIVHAGVNFKAQGMEFTCHFEAGKEYVIRGESEDRQWGVGVYQTAKWSEMSPDTRIAFIPFKNQPKFN